jgi:plasmid stabilization system protein ParE
VGDSIDAAVAGLGAFPEIGRMGRVLGTRELVIPRTPYVAIYRIATSGSRSYASSMARSDGRRQTKMPHSRALACAVALV